MLSNPLPLVASIAKALMPSCIHGQPRYAQVAAGDPRVADGTPPAAQNHVADGLGQRELNAVDLVCEQVEQIAYELAVRETGGDAPRLTDQEVFDRARRGVNLVFGIVEVGVELNHRLRERVKDPLAIADEVNGQLQERAGGGASELSLRQICGALITACAQVSKELDASLPANTKLCAALTEVASDLLVCMESLPRRASDGADLERVVYAEHAVLAANACIKCHRDATRQVPARPVGSAGGREPDGHGQPLPAPVIDALGCMRAARFFDLSSSSHLKAGATPPAPYAEVWRDDVENNVGNQVPLKFNAQDLTRAEIVRLNKQGDRLKDSWPSELREAVNAALKLAERNIAESNFGTTVGKDAAGIVAEMLFPSPQRSQR